MTDTITAAQLDYDAQWGYDATYFNAALAKETAYANTTRTLDTNYATSVVGSVVNYLASQTSSSATSLNRTKTSDQAEVDPRIGYYLAYENAEYAQALTTVIAKEDALTRKLSLYSLWSEYVLDKTSTYDTVQYGGYGTLTWSSSYTSMPFPNSTGGVVATMPRATSLDGIAISGLEYSGAPSSIANMALSTYSLLWQGYNGNNLWTAFENLNTALRDAERQVSQVPRINSRSS